MEQERKSNSHMPSNDIQQSYDAIAEEYVRNIYDELQHKPLDRELLNRFADAVRDAGLVCDIGTGPGHVARYLHDRAVQVCGIDLSPKMVAQARRLNPGIDFREGDMFALDVPNETFGGMTAFYAIVNLPRASVVRALRELHRVLKPNGLLLLAFHLGDETLRKEEMWGIPVALDFVLFGRDEMVEYLREAGFDIREVIERDPYPDVEHPSRRAYIFARKIA
ncbi:MAG: class I SAM-dependent methyltransferase [Chthoniobacterales bacterium]